MSDSTEVYYAEMEAARNSACDAYFAARPYLERDSERAQYKALFYAGFERAFAMLWHGGRAAQETPAAPKCDCEGPQKIGPDYHAPYCSTVAGGKELREQLERDSLNR
jgi:hypothetical protein